MNWYESLFVLILVFVIAPAVFMAIFDRSPVNHDDPPPKRTVAELPPDERPGWMIDFNSKEFRGPGL